MIEEHIRQDLSPEQVSGFLERKHYLNISHETIYQNVLKNKAKGGDLYSHLRHSYKKRKKRYGSHDRRGQIKTRVSIDERPAIVDTKERIGDWEIDTIIGKNHNGALIRVVERKSKFTLIRKLSYRQAKLVADSAIDLLTPYEENVYTIIAGNGQEVVHHERIGKELKTHIYFAHPYHAWERGVNENTNGLIGQYFPKGHSFQTITDNQVQMLMDRLNNRLRKTLGFKTPNEVFIGPVMKQAA